MIDYAALKAEVANPAYAGFTDAQLLAALNAKTVPSDGTHKPIPIADARQLLIRAGVVGAAQVYADDANNPAQLRIACITLVQGLLNEVFSVLDLDDPLAKAQLDQQSAALIMAGTMTADQQTALYALGTKPLALWKDVVVGFVGDITQPDLDYIRSEVDPA